MKSEINNYLRASEMLVRKFYETYFWDGEEEINEDCRYGIGIDDHGPNVYDFGDYFFDISDIFVALKHNATKEQLFDWNEYGLNISLGDIDKPRINLFSWIHGNRIYTKEEQEEDNKRIKEKFNILEDSINNSKVGK